MFISFVKLFRFVKKSYNCHISSVKLLQIRVSVLDLYPFCFLNYEFNTFTLFYYYNEPNLFYAISYKLISNLIR